MEELDYNKIKMLSDAMSSSRGTSLITKYIPANTNLQTHINHLNEELSTAKNIKSKVVRNDVQTALKSGINRLKTQKAVPENGLVLCSGIINSCF